MSFEAEYDDLIRLEADLKGAADRVGPQAQRVVRKALRDVTAGGKRRAPVDTGFLRASIRPSDLRTVGQSGVIEGVTGPTAHYGGYVERGTSKMAPRPYMVPALAAVEPSFVAAIEALGGEVL